MIERIWLHIQHCAGQIFRMIRGAEFTYDARGNYIALNRTNQSIPKSDFAKALERLPLVSTTNLQDLRGPSFVFAILTDDRICQDDY